MRVSAEEKVSLDAQLVVLTASYRSLRELFPNERDVELDMGCGNGSFTTQLAQHYPEHLIYASDVMIGRLRKLQKRCNRLNIENLKCLRVESRHLLYMIPDRVLNRLHLLCPDPWPKDKHRANRLMSSDFYTHIHRVLKPGGIFHFSSDEPEYFDSVESLIALSGGFTPAPEALADIAGIQSDFEKRWLSQGKRVRHGVWKRIEPPLPAIGH